MKPSTALLMLIQSLIWLDFASQNKVNAPEWHEHDLVTAAIFHGMWLDHTWPA